MAAVWPSFGETSFSDDHSCFPLMEKSPSAEPGGKALGGGEILEKWTSSERAEITFGAGEIG